ncbi:MAG: TolC family protein, partial [Elusimicrobia bacterium]|nr:TolC family protein [Elusimicrobiota bacterium]
MPRRPRLLVLLALALAATPAVAGMTASDYVRLALAASPEARSAEESAAAAADAYRSAFAGAFLPSASFSWSDSLYGDDPARGVFHGLRMKRNDQTTTTGASWNLFNGFQDYLRVRASAESRDSAAVSLRATREARALAAVQAYFRLVTQKRLVEVASLDLAAQEEQFHRTESLYRSGLKGLSDVYKSETEWRSSQVRMISAESSYKTTLEPFNSLIDRAPWTEPELAADLALGTTELPRLEEDAARLTERLPELAVALKSVEKARLSEKQALLKALPSLSADASWTKADAEGAGLWSARASRRVGLLFSLPVGFNGFSQAYDVAGARAARRSAQAEADRELRAARDALYSAWVALEAATKTYALAVRQEEIAARGLEIVETQYNQGSTDALRMAQARSDLLTARVQSATAL